MSPARIREQASSNLLSLALRIYTRTGDDGTTGLFGGRRVSKHDPRIEACGDVDELNAHLGLAIADSRGDDLCAILSRLQNELFVVGADLATPLSDQETHGGIAIRRVDSDMTVTLERDIDRLDLELPPLQYFILPGGSVFSARLHVCRAACRRAERSVTALSQIDATNPAVTRYLNRMSDLLFVMARCANKREGVEDVAWRP